MILRRAFSHAFPRKHDQAAQVRNAAAPTLTMPELLTHVGAQTISGENVTTEKSKSVAAFYRGANIISDDIASMPLQTFVSRKTGELERVKPDPFARNIAFLLEKQPNRWWSPFMLKKSAIQWLIHHGNAYIWQPPRTPRELFVLPANATYPEFDADGNLFYHTTFLNGRSDDIPDVEILHLLINPDATGFVGRGVVQFARETLGNRLGGMRTQAKFFKQGLNMNGIMQMAGDINKDARKKIRDEFADAVGGSDNAFGVAVIDQKVIKFEPITMKFTDAQFLDSMQYTDQDIANFLGIPLYKLNQGKQSYQSNEQQDLDYLKTTLNAYLVQWEQAAALRWLSAQEQGYTFFEFERNAILRTDAKTRGEYLNAAIQSARLTPNQALQIENLPGYGPIGDKHYMPSNITAVD